MDEFLVRAALGGIGIALLAAPLGCFVVWQRMAYFGETIAHAGLLGVALALIMEVHLTIGVFVCAVFVALGLRVIEQRSNLAKDTALGLLAHVILALGLIIASLMPTLRVDLMGLLFGDILAISRYDLVVIFIGGAIIVACVIKLWNDLMAISIDKELAGAEGINVKRTEFLFAVLIAATIALAMKIVGLLLVTAMLIIPAASAIHVARTPEQMAFMAAIISALSVIAGLVTSLYVDIPTGPAIVVSMAGFFIILSALKKA